MLRIVLAVIHLLALGIGLGAIFARARAANGLGTMPDAVRRVLAADTWWAVAAVLWVSTGLWRAIAGTEKLPAYYWTNPVFHAKMGFFVLIVLLELWPMITLRRWRRAQATSTPASVETLVPAGKKIARISDVQMLLLVAMIVAATLLARGFGGRA